MPDFSDQVKTPPVTKPPVRDELTGRSVGRFRVEARLGAGGMGEVYRAFDTKLQRTVAIKRMVWREEMTPADRALFLREGQRASALNHPNIAGIYDVIEEQDDLLLVMEYVEGSTLRAELGPPIPAERFFSIATQCADALAAAHEKGILHGDVKPENIMLTPAGQVKLLDFGVARRLGGADPFGATVATHTLSAPGVMAGTPVYMAPEVLKGEMPDARADIFALGIVLYEMLAGKHPFAGTNVTVTTAQILSEREATVLDRTPLKVSPRLAAVVARALMKDPAQRYPEMVALHADLEAVREGGRPAKVVAGPWWPWTLAAAAVLVLGVIAALPGVRAGVRHWWTHRRQAGAVITPAAAPRLAVLPPRIDGQSAQLSAFADGLSEAVAAKIETLSQNHDVQVIDSSRVKKVQAAAPEQVMKALGANMTLQLVVQQAQGMNRVTYTLAGAQKGQMLAVQTLTAPIGDPFSLQDQVADGVVHALQITLRPEEQAALAVHGTTEPAAYDYYLQGRGYLEDRSRPENLTNAIAVLDRALALDANFGRALAQRGEAEWFTYTINRQSAWVDKAKEDCEKAIGLGNAGADGHYCLGLVDAGTGKYEDAASDYQKAIDLEPTAERAYVGLANAYAKLNRLGNAENAYRQAISANPGSGFAHEQLGNFYLQQAEYAKAADLFKQTIALTPESYIDYSNLGAAYLYLGNYGEAIKAMEQSLKLRPTANAYANLGTAYYQGRKFADAARNYQAALRYNDHDSDMWGNLASAYHFSGQQTKAMEAYRKQLALINEQLQVNPKDAERQGDAASVYAALGDKPDSMQHLARSLELGRGDKDLLFNAAVVYNDLGETGDALEWLQKSLVAGYSASIVRDSPEFDNLRNDPQFQQLLSRALVK